MMLIELVCEALPKNSNIVFTSWTGDYVSSNDNPTNTFKPFKYGNLTANFIQGPVQHHSDSYHRLVHTWNCEIDKR
jgi:hypothetical protein